MRRPLVICDFATAPFWISLFERKILFSFLSVYKTINLLYIPVVGLAGPAPGRTVAAAGQSAAQRGAAAHS
jgi:hypothetical protein